MTKTTAAFQIVAACILVGLLYPAWAVEPPVPARQMPPDELKTSRDKWLYVHYTTGRGKGTAKVDCAGPAEVGQVIPKITVRYLPGKGGIAPGGSVTVWFPSGSTPPQFEDAKKPGFLEVSAGDSPVEVSTDYVWIFRERKAHANAGHRLHAIVKLPEGLPEGQELTFRISKVGVGRYARRWEGDRFLFRVYVDHDADGWEEEIRCSPWVPKIPTIANRLVMRAQSTAVVGEPVRLTVMAMDRYDNPAIFYRGTVRFSAESDDATLPQPYTLTEQDNGCHTFSCSFDAPGFKWVHVEDPEAGFRNVGSPIEVFADEPEYRLYWGDLHVHTELSADAMNGAHAVTTYPGAYKIGRYRYGLDFMANTDHHGFNSYSPEDWQWMKQVTNDANSPGKFITIVAKEISHGRGDQNVYFLDDDPPYVPESGPKHPQDLWRFLRDHECFSVPHHFAQSMRPWDWRNYDPELMKVAEIFSNHGRAEFFGNQPDYTWHDKGTLEGRTWQDQLNKGRKIGCIAATDDHWGRPGYCGLAAVWAKALTREEIYGNIKRKHCYASSNARAIVHFQANGKDMGETIRPQRPPLFEVRAASPTKVLEAVIIKNGETVFAAKPDGKTIQFAWKDEDYAPGAWYYFRMTMEGRPTAEDFLRDKPEFAWSGPIWVE